MISLILRTATRYLLPLLMLYSVFLLLKGHDKPGGGFIGGLLAASAVVLAALAFDPSMARRITPLVPHHLLGAGLITMAASGTWKLFRGEPFLTAAWWTISLPGVGPIHIGTPLLFDVGVYLTVTGATLTLLLALAEEGIVQ